MGRRNSSALARDDGGAMAIEVAVVAPLLILLSLGTFEVGTMVSRQQELQSAASEAEAIILAAAGGTGTDSDTIRDVITDSLGLRNEQVRLGQRFRCGDTDSLTTDASTCDTSAPVYRYVRLEVSDTYTPVWARFGLGRNFDYNIQRTVLVQ